MATRPATPQPIEQWEDVTDKFSSTPANTNNSANWGDVTAVSPQVQRRQRMAAGQDIPPNSPLGQEGTTPGFWESLAHGFGIPTDQKSAMAYGINAMLPPGVGQIISQGMNLSQAHSIPQALQAFTPLDVTTMAQQVGEQNWKGLAGSLIPPAAMTALGGIGSRLATPKATVPITYKAEGTPMGPLMDALGVLSPRLMHAMQLARKLTGSAGGLKKANVPVTEAPPPAPPVSYTGTDFPLNQPSPATPLPKSSPAPTPPLRPVGDWFRPQEEITGGAVAGDAPRQPLLNPSKKGPRTQTNLEKNLEPSHIGDHDSLPPPDSFIPDHLAEVNNIMPDGKTIITKVNKELGTAEVLKLNPAGGKATQATLPIRSLSNAALEQWNNLMQQMIEKAEGNPESKPSSGGGGLQSPKADLAALDSRLATIPTDSSSHSSHTPEWNEFVARTKEHPQGWRPVVLDRTKEHPGHTQLKPEEMALVRDAVERLGQKFPHAIKTISRVEITNNKGFSALVPDPEYTRGGYLNASHIAFSPRARFKGGVIILNIDALNTRRAIMGPIAIDGTLWHEAVHAAQDYIAKPAPTSLDWEASAHRRGSSVLGSNPPRAERALIPPLSPYELKHGPAPWRTMSARENFNTQLDPFPYLDKVGRSGGW